MLRTHATLMIRVVMLLDAAVVGIGFFLAYFLLDAIYVRLAPLPAYLWILPVLMFLWSALLAHYGMYASFRLKRLQEVLVPVLRAGCVSFIILGGISFLAKTSYVSRVLILTMFLLATVGIALEKIVIFLLLRRVRSRGFNFRTLLVVGTGPRAQRFISEVNLHREFGIKIAGLVDEPYEGRPDEVMGHEVLGTLRDIPRILCEHNVDIVVFVVPRSLLNRIEEAVQFCETVGVPASVAVDLFNLRHCQGKESRLFGFPLLTFERSECQWTELFLKRLTDVVISAIALALLTPLIGLIGLMVKLTSRGPVFFRQMRCGLNGRSFTIYKFRTMEEHAEDKVGLYQAYNTMNGPAFKLEDDPRVTSVGRVLRKFSLDEIPQFWNVLKGEMSLVGPRPPLPREVLQYDHWQRRRLSMRPGITCLWQVNGRSNIRDFNAWMKLDLEYIDNWSLWRDCVILLKTIPEVISGRGAK